MILNSIVGHNKIINKLTNAYKNNKLSHNLLFVGPKAIGKKKLALGLMQFISCEKNSLSCGKCPQCIRISNQKSEDLLIIKPEGHQIKIEQSKQINNFLNLKSLNKSRGIIIDEAQTMNQNAANAILKILEEPPPNTYFFLITSNESAILPTIKSRSQFIRFGHLQPNDIIKINPVSEWVAKSCLGSLEYIEQFDNENFIEIRNKTIEFLEMVINNKKIESYSLIKPYLNEQNSTNFIIRTLITLIRDAILVQLKSNEIIINNDQKKILEKLSQLSKINLIKIIQNILNIEKGLQQNFDKNLLFEDLSINFYKNNLS